MDPHLFISIHFRNILSRRLLWLISAGLAFGSIIENPAAAAAQAAKNVSSRPGGGSREQIANVFRLEKLNEMDAAVARAIEAGKLPGGVLWLEREQAFYRRAYGRRALIPHPEPMSEDTIFDAASLTKVIATTPCIMRLVEQGRIQLNESVSRYLPSFKGDGREMITVRHLLTHTSGLRPGIPATPAWSGLEHGLELALAEKPQTQPGSAFRYSDVNFILLGAVVREVSGSPLDEFARENVFKPLGMNDTMFRPPGKSQSRIAPTTVESDGKPLRGVVHDPTARRMGGVAGHAGLFTTAADLARFCRMLLNQGSLGKTRVFLPETVRDMTSVHTAASVSARRGLGWDIDSPYAGPRGEYLPLGSYGHTGWTGTSLWIDPHSKTFLVFLSNRNHPSEDGSVIALRRELGTLAAAAVAGYNFVYVPGALAARPQTNTNGASNSRGGTALANLETLAGIDVLARTNFSLLKGKRVGLITNHTGQDARRTPTIDLLAKAEGVVLKALFSPEHGIRGVLDEKVADGIDERTGLVIHSLYGDARQPPPSQLRELDALVFDIQDIGCRFYTYISTLGLALEAAAAAGIEVVVLDRPNPIGGVLVEGPVHTAASSFIAYHSIPVRHGMTVGELARMFQAERAPSVLLTVIPLQGWRREAWFDQCGLPWSNPSPNMRSLTQATLYPGIGLLETALSVGRGTDTPFEVAGAPYVDDVLLARELNKLGIGGVRFIPIRFTPTASVFKGLACGGVRLVVTDRSALRPVELGMAMAAVLQRLYPGQFALDKVQTLLQEPGTIAALREGKSVAEMAKSWEPGMRAFMERREKFLLYR